MANLSPGVYTKIIDLSTFVQIVPGTVGFICALTEKGEDNKLKFLGSRNELVDEFGNPDISKYGSQYGQGPYIAYNYLGESGSLYFMRCLPDDAAYSNLRIYGSPLISPVTYPYSLDSSASLFIDYISDLNNIADITTATQIFGNNVPLVVFYAIGRGEYYNDIGITILEDMTQRDQGIYNLNIYETQSDGSYTLIESFKISFNPDEKNQETKESIYVEYVLERYSKVLRCKVGNDGYELIEKIYERDVEDVSVSSSGSTSFIDSTSIVYIDTTSIEHVVIYDGSLWATTPSLNVSRTGIAGCGTTSGALSFGGGTTARVATTEKWNGSAWATTTDLTNPRISLAGCGTTSGALSFGGGTTARVATTEKWNGSAWATTTDLTNPRSYLAGCGTTSDALSFGGGTTTAVTTTEKWNGSLWATTYALNTTRRYLAGCGTTSDALAIGGGPTAPSNVVEKTIPSIAGTWATTSNMVQNVNAPGGCGNISDSLCFGGETGAIVTIVTTEIWNGSSWATTSNLTYKRSFLAGCGTTLGALALGGSTNGGTDGETNVSEKWSGSSWATTSVINTARYSLIACGDTSNALNICGTQNSVSGLSITDKWNGSSWTTTTNSNFLKFVSSIVGTTSNALSCGGITGSSTEINSSEVWNGSTWATTSALNLSRGYLGASGNLVSALSFGGSTLTASVETWNGSSWATATALVYSLQKHVGCGTSDNALAFGGASAGGNYSNKTQIWHTFSVVAWATTSSLNQSRLGLAACGTTSDALSYGGFNTAISPVTEIWNGSAWATTSSLNVARQYLAGCGVTGDALAFGGETTGISPVTERWYSTYHTNTIIHHHYIPEVIHHHTEIITDLFQLIDTGQDFTYYETNPETGIALYCAIVKDSFDREIYGWLGAASNEGKTVNIWKDNHLDTAQRGWLGEVSTFDFDDENMVYRIKRSNLFPPDLFSIRPLKKGKEGSLISQGIFDEDIATEILANGYNGTIDTEVLNIDHMYFNTIFDAGYPKDVKDQIVGLAEVRDDAVAIIDNSDNISVNNSIITRNNTYNYNTYYASIFEPYSRIFDIFTERHVWFSPCYHLSYILPRNDRLGELWYAAAGARKGVCRDIKELRFGANQSQRDLLYTHQINPIIKQNSDYILWGQLTSQSKASALQDLNVVRLVLYIKRALKQYCQNFIFEENSQLLYNTVRNDITAFLEQIKRKRGLYNSTIDIGATEFETKMKTFHINIILEPLKTTEKVELNFYIK